MHKNQQTPYQFRVLALKGKLQLAPSIQANLTEKVRQADQFQSFIGMEHFLAFRLLTEPMQ